LKQAVLKQCWFVDDDKIVVQNAIATKNPAPPGFIGIISVGVAQ
jgi:hypothetical protein